MEFRTKQSHFLRIDKNHVLPLVIYIHQGVQFTDLDFQVWRVSDSKQLLSLLQEDVIPSFLQYGLKEDIEFRRSGALYFSLQFRESSVGFSILSRTDKPFEPKKYAGGAFSGFIVAKATLYIDILDPLREVKERPPNVISHFWNPQWSPVFVY